MRRVLLTNSSGFVGSNLYKVLAEKKDIELLVAVNGRSAPPQLCFASPNGRRVINVSVDFSKRVDYYALMSDLSERCFDTVFHTAGIAKVNESPPTLFSANIQSTFNILEDLCAPGCRFIFTSSSTVYGDGNRLIHFDEHDQLRPTSLYGASKVASEAMIDAYTRSGKIKGVSLRLCANVGPGATHGLLKDLIRKAKADEQWIELFGDNPGSIKPFVHVEDTARAALWLAEEKADLVGAYNLANEDSLSVSEVTNLVMAQTQVKSKHWLGEASTWTGDNKEFSISSQKIRRAGFIFNYPSSREAVTQAIKENL